MWHQSWCMYAVEDVSAVTGWIDMNFCLHGKAVDALQQLERNERPVYTSYFSKEFLKSFHLRETELYFLYCLKNVNCKDNMQHKFLNTTDNNCTNTAVLF